MPHASAASSRECPSSTSAIASIRRAALASPLRAAACRSAAADNSHRMISTAMSASRTERRGKRITAAASAESHASQRPMRLVLLLRLSLS